MVGPGRRFPLKTLLTGVLLTGAVVLLTVLAVRVLQLIPQVQRERTATPTPPPFYGNVMLVTVDPNAPTEPPVLRRNSQGDDVQALQQRLADLGYYTGAVDGLYGNGTEAAVFAFQQANQLQADGKVGSETRARLYSEDALPASVWETPAPTPTPTASPTPRARRPYERPDGLPLVVNRSEPLPENYQSYDLVTMNRYCDSSVVKIKYKGTLAEREAVDALMVMLRAAKADGIGNWQISAAYRDRAYQQRLFDNKVSSLMKENGLSRSKAVSAARKTVADPGTSEHHLGVCFDITVPGVSFSGTKQHKWIAEHCWEYGFILRYTKEKSDITGFSAEAWHYRWVGREHAEAMHRENLCLEEYVAKYGVEVGEETDY